jgi:hypothetical protein
MASGEMTGSEFTHFLQTAFRNMADHSKDGAIHFLLWLPSLMQEASDPLSM